MDSVAKSDWDQPWPEHCHRQKRQRICLRVQLRQPHSQERHSAAAPGTVNAVLAKLDNNTGDVLWVQWAGDAGDKYGYGVATDNAGNVYITGHSIPDKGNMFVVKYDTDGNELWERLIGGTLADIGRGIAVDPAGSDVYVVGYTSNTIINGSTNPTPAETSIQLHKLSAVTGDLNWVRFLGNTSDDVGTGVVVDPLGTGIYVTG